MTMTDAHRVTSLLASTQRLITPFRHWCKGKPLVSGEHCLITGLIEAKYREGCRTAILDRAERLLYDALMARPEWAQRGEVGLVPMRLALIHFNDHSETTHADVLALLDDAMKAA